MIVATNEMATIQNNIFQTVFIKTNLAQFSNTKSGFYRTMGFDRPVGGFGFERFCGFHTFAERSSTIKHFIIMFILFLEGGPWMMSVLTLLLVALFFVAWKAPNWVKETGKAALAFGFLSLLMGVHQAAHFIAQADPAVDSNIIWGGMSVAMIPAMYGIIIYLISLIISVIQKPRI